MKKENCMIVTNYQIQGEGFPEMRIALAADLHDRPPEEVLGLLGEQKPDLILVAGDLMERHEAGITDWTVEEMDEWQGLTRRSRIVSKIVKLADRVLLPGGNKKRWDEENGRAFLKTASGIAPVFYGIGNHEWYFTEEDRELIRRHGVTVLDNADTAMVLKSGRRVRIGGLSTRYNLEWLKCYSEKPGYKILICHHPEYYERFIRNTPLDRFGLVVSGHAHGGQWRVGGRGVLAPGQGLFPKYTHGIFEEKFVISAGLSNTANIPRFGNPRELVMIRIESA